MNALRTTLPAGALLVASCFNPSDDDGGADGTGSTTAAMTADPTTAVTAPTTTLADTGTGTTVTTGSDSGTGDCETCYEFRTEPYESATPLDRLGQPAVNAAVHFGDDNALDEYNTQEPTDDIMAGATFDLSALLDNLHLGSGGSTGLTDDIMDLGFEPCTPPVSINDNCFSQIAPFVFPDVLTLDTAAPTSPPVRFPNGRALADPAVDIVLTLMLLDVESTQLGGLPGTGTEDFDALATFGLSQGTGNDKNFLSEFPYVGAPN